MEIGSGATYGSEAGHANAGDGATSHQPGDASARAQLHHAAAAARIGPNAIIQTAAALSAVVSPQDVRCIFETAGIAGYLTAGPATMVGEDEVAALFHAVDLALPPADAAAVARASGRATADYIVANRIPRTVRNVLAWLPRWMAARVLLASIRRHSWTFAGSGRVTATTGRQLALTIAVNPIARPGCHWHVAVFERLFKVLISPDARVTHPCCCARGDTACRFEIDI